MVVARAGITSNKLINSGTWIIPFTDLSQEARNYDLISYRKLNTFLYFLLVKADSLLSRALKSHDPVDYQ